MVSGHPKSTGIPWVDGLSKGPLGFEASQYGIIRSHIGSIQDCGMVIKLEIFSHLFGQSFGLGLRPYHWCFY